MAWGGLGPKFHKAAATTQPPPRTHTHTHTPVASACFGCLMSGMLLALVGGSVRLAKLSPLSRFRLVLVVERWTSWLAIGQKNVKKERQNREKTNPSLTQT